MLIGLISDTHDNLESLDRALKFFREKNVSYILHAGDWISPFTLVKLASSNIPVAGVLGNNEGEVLLLMDRAEKHNVKLSRYTLALTLNGKRLIVYHGTDENILNALVKSGLYDVVVYGHTHKVRVEKVGGTLVVNPGECSGVLFGEPTVGILDLKTLDVNIYRLE